MRVTKVEKLTGEKWLNLFAASFEHDGHGGRWLFCSRKHDPRQGRDAVDAVIIVPILHAPGQPPRLVLLKEYRVPVEDTIYALPAGLLEGGESVEDTARRELREETGLQLTRVKRVSPQLYSSAGLTDESVVLAFVDAEATPGGKPSPDHGEDFEVLLLDYNAVCRLCVTPARFDAKAWAVLYLYQVHGRLE